MLVFCLLLSLAFVYPVIAAARDRQMDLARGGCCLKCGYDRRGIGKEDPCPECGNLPGACDACGYDRRGIGKDEPCPECGDVPTSCRACGYDRRGIAAGVLCPRCGMA